MLEKLDQVRVWFFDLDATKLSKKATCMPCALKNEEKREGS